MVMGNSHLYRVTQLYRVNIHGVISSFVEYGIKFLQKLEKIYLKPTDKRAFGNRKI